MSDKKITQPYTKANLEKATTAALRTEMKDRGILVRRNVRKAEMVSSLLTLPVMCSSFQQINITYNTSYSK